MSREMIVFDKAIDIMIGPKQTYTYLTMMELCTWLRRFIVLRIRVSLYVRNQSKYIRVTDIFQETPTLRLEARGRDRGEG